ncbi:GrpB family protein [Brevibacillus sp. MS2.2]|uniref:GrpB family protein n=1 Tax=Brevibacillus sp. MS2.2 TaxID=2738981 RepID=UPI00156B8CE4|nr:GrpB family protein [Brevibacillus sp. MS2.2]NRR22416.1 GrpB family protein [Brevibacillus sp. MS2.2]
MKYISFIQYPDKKIRRFPVGNELEYFFDISSSELSKIKEVRVGVRGYISLTDDKDNELLGHRLFGGIDSLWLELVESVEKLMHDGFGATIVQNCGLIMETYSKTLVKFYITSEEGAYKKPCRILSQKDFIDTILDGAKQFFCRLKEHLKTNQYDEDLLKIDELLRKAENFQPIDPYFHYPNETTRVNTFLFQHNEDWREMFEKERAYLMKLITETDYEIQHVGSTAINTLSARPVIDILIGTKSKWSTEMIVNDIHRDYFYQETSFPVNACKKGTPPDCQYNIYVTEKNSPFWNSVITFRDKLLTDEDLAKEYDELKRKASACGDLQDYENQKSAFIERNDPLKLA